MPKVQLYYFPLRGRAEVVRLVLAANNVEWDALDVDYPKMKVDREAYPFGQAPRLVDGDINVVQSNTIIRYLGRKFDMLGDSEADKVAVDMVIEGVESLRMKYVNLIYNDKLSEEAKENYWKTYLDRSNTETRNGGSHLHYLTLFLTKNGGQHVAGSKLSVGDLCLWDIYDLHARIFPQIGETYPELASFHAAVSELPGIKEYLAGPLRMAKINGNDLG